MDMIKIPYEWLETGGEGSTVAVIDGHINTSSAAYSSVSVYRKYNQEKIYDTSHCTHICEIINSVAPLAKIIVYQAMCGNVGTILGIKIALKDIMKEKFDVLNLSMSSICDDSEFEYLMKEISSRAIVVASISNNNKIKSFPSSYPSVISVASIDNHSKGADLYTNDLFYINGEQKKSGNSMSTALISGICSLAKSFDKKINKELFLRQLH